MCDQEFLVFSNSSKQIGSCVYACAPALLEKNNSIDINEIEGLMLEGAAPEIADPWGEGDGDECEEGFFHGGLGFDAA